MLVNSQNVSSSWKDAGDNSKNKNKLLNEKKENTKPSTLSFARKIVKCWAHSNKDMGLQIARNAIAHCIVTSSLAKKSNSQGFAGVCMRKPTLNKNEYEINKNFQECIEMLAAIASVLMSLVNSCSCNNILSCAIIILKT